MFILQSIDLFVTWAITALIVAAILLIILRAVFNYMDVNPFTWHARNVRRVTDPVLAPVRAMLMAFRLDPKVAPFIAAILILVAGYLILQLAGTLLNTIAGILYAVASHSADTPIAIIGYVLFGLLGLYTLAIFVRIIFVWVGGSYANPWLRSLGTVATNGAAGRDVRYLSDHCVPNLMGVPGRRCANAFGQVAA